MAPTWLRLRSGGRVGTRAPNPGAEIRRPPPRTGRPPGRPRRRRRIRFEACPLLVSPRSLEHPVIAWSTCGLIPERPIDRGTKATCRITDARVQKSESSLLEVDDHVLVSTGRVQPEKAQCADVGDVSEIIRSDRQRNQAMVTDRPRAASHQGYGDLRAHAKLPLGQIGPTRFARRVGDESTTDRDDPVSTIMTAPFVSSNLIDAAARANVGPTITIKPLTALGLPLINALGIGVADGPDSRLRAFGAAVRDTGNVIV